MSSRIKDKAGVKEGGLANEVNSQKKDGGQEAAQNGLGGGVTSQSANTSSSVPSGRDRRRQEHNEMEKRRKDKIKSCINKIGDLLPPFKLVDRERPSTLEIVEKALSYIQHLKEMNARLLKDTGNIVQAEEIERLQKELADVKAERDRLTEMLKTNGLPSAANTMLAWDSSKNTGNRVDLQTTSMIMGDNSTEVKSTNGVSSTTDPSGSLTKDENPKSKSKSKKRNTISAQLQNMRSAKSQQEAQSQQEMITSSVSVSEDGMPNPAAASQMLGLPGGQFLSNQNMMFNPMMMSGNGQFMMPGGMNSTNGIMGNSQGDMGYGSPMSTNNAANVGGASVDKNEEDAGAGLLQLAMQDAGITPQSSSGNSQTTDGMSVSTPASPTPEPSSEERRNQGGSNTSALQTLASVASNTQNISMETGNSSAQTFTDSQALQTRGMMTSTTSAMNTNIPIMSSGQMQGQAGQVGQAGFQSNPAQQMIQTGNALINMPMMGNQGLNILQTPSMPSGQVMQQGQTQQLMFINEQGVPVIANVPVGIDPNNPAFQKQVASGGVMGNINQQMKDQTGNMDQNALNNAALALAQQQANMAAMQGQLMGMSQGQGQAGGTNALQNMAFQQQNLMGGGIIQGGQYIQQMPGQIVGGQGQAPGQLQGMVPQSGQNNMTLPVSQNGNYLTLNMPNQPNTLPSALLLPNGQIIPVVTNPSNVITQQGQPGVAGSVVNQPRLQNPNQQGMEGITNLQGHGQVMVGPQGQVIQAQSSQSMGGLLMPAVSSTTQASTSTSVVSTSSLQSIMTPQIQGSAAQRTVANSTPTNTDASMSSMQQGNQMTISSDDSKPGLQLVAPKTSVPNQGNIIMAGNQVGNIMQQSQATPILISLPINGQLTSVLVDPVTMQVLGKVQQQGAPGQPQGSAPVPIAQSQTATMGPPAVTTTTGSNQGSKSKKKNSQRAICPKPSSSVDGSKSQAVSSSSKKKKKAAKEPIEQPDSVSDGLQVQLLESTTEPDTSTQAGDGSPSTDILGRAVESTIFGDMSPPIGGGFYNPANEDNPLHIDTSVADGEDEKHSSPKKQSMAEKNKANVTPAGESKSPHISVISDTNLISPVNDVASLSSVTSVQGQGTVGSDTGSKGQDQGQGSNVVAMEIMSESEKKIEETLDSVIGSSTKKSKSGGSSKTIDQKSKDSNEKKSSKGGKSHKKQMEQKKVEEVMDESQVLPESITFTESELCDVLDQVENLGTLESPPKVTTSTPAKKSKSKRSKANSDTDTAEPSSKKRKGNTKEKDSGKNEIQNMPLIDTQPSMENALSVYDFDGDGTDDITPILPLHKSFSSSVSSADNSDISIGQSTGSLFPKLDADDSSNKMGTGSKSAKSTSQSKGGKGSSSRSSKNSKSSSKASLSANQKQQEKSGPTNTLFYFPETTETEKQISKDSDVNKSSAQSLDSLANLPEIDTTTSIFGFPITSVSPKTQPSLSNQQKSSADLSTGNQQSSASSVITSNSAQSVTTETSKPLTVNVSNVQNSFASSEPLFSSPSYSSQQNVLKPNTKSSSGSMVNSSHDSFQGNKMPESQPDFLSDLNSVAKQPNIVSPPNKSQVTSDNMSAANSQRKQQRGNFQGGPSSLSQTNFGGNSNRFQADPNFNAASSSCGMLPKDPNLTSPHSNPCSALNNFSSPYSAESLFNSPEKAGAALKSPQSNDSGSQAAKSQVKGDNSADVGISKSRSSNIYSADNFVQSSREDPLRNKNDSMNNPTEKVLNTNDSDNSSYNFSRLQNESSSDGFNFASIGLNLTPITSTSNNFMDNLNLPGSSSAAPVTTVSTFSFSLSSASTTVTSASTSSSNPHQFPFYSMLPSVPPVSQFSPESDITTSQNQQQPNIGLFGHEIPRADNPMQSTDNSNLPRDSVQQSDSSLMPRVDNSHMQRGDNLPQPDNTQNTAGKLPCTKQPKMSSQSQSSVPEPFSFSMSNPSSAPEQAFFSNPQMKSLPSNVQKNPPEQIRNNQPDKIMPSANRPSNTSQPDKRTASTINRSPQMHNTGQPYFSPPSYPTSKSMNTPTLHHGSMMGHEDRRRTMTNRSPYEPNFPVSSQGFNVPPHSFPPSNRYDGNMNFNRDRPGTQPLTHPPAGQNSGGRKSANPPPPPKQSVQPQMSQSHPSASQGPLTGPVAPPSGPSAPPTMSSRPTPPQSLHRPTPSQAPPPQPQATPPQVSQGRQQQKQASRNSKQQKKKNQSYIEVDSNLSHSIFEPSRSMTPYFPSMQNLSPQSRGMQPDGPSLFPGNFFGAGPRLPNSNTPVPKNSDIGPPFNSFFPSGRAQNGLGLNFQPGFGMNMNPLHGNHGNGPQITPHSGSVGVTPHMTNFSLSNIFSEVNSVTQNESLNISPIKFPHTNSMLQHQSGVDPNSLQHHHQYNRGHPPPSVMSINSILGPNHHGFDGRSLGQMNSSMTPPFHGHGHPAAFIPPLNFSMHDH